MAENSSNPITFLVTTTKEHLQSLAQIRHFENLKVAFEGNNIWVKDFSLEQIDSALVKTLPFKSIYYLKENLLFPKGSLLPKAKLPKLLLWASIQQAFALEDVKLNHNFFGIHDTIQPRLIPSTKERDTFALLTPLNFETKKTIENAAAFRLKKLKYTIINDIKLLILGIPNLPIQSHGFWLNNDFLFPNGYTLEFDILLASIKEKINPSGNFYVFWQNDNSYSLIAKSDFMPLSISSFRLSLTAPKV